MSARTKIETQPNSRIVGTAPDPIPLDVIGEAPLLPSPPSLERVTHHGPHPSLERVTHHGPHPFLEKVTHHGPPSP